MPRAMPARRVRLCGRAQRSSVIRRGEKTVIPIEDAYIYASNPSPIKAAFREDGASPSIIRKRVAHAAIVDLLRIRIAQGNIRNDATPRSDAPPFPACHLRWKGFVEKQGQGTRT